jgi:hypothetical protein
LLVDAVEEAVEQVGAVGLVVVGGVVALPLHLPAPRLAHHREEHPHVVGHRQHGIRVPFDNSVSAMRPAHTR